MTTEFASVELILLAASVILGIVHTIGVTFLKLSADPLAGAAAKAERALHNYLETFAFFAAAVLIVTVRETHTLLTVLGAHFYFWSRIAYVILYAADMPRGRCLVWMISMIGILMEVGAMFVK